METTANHLADPVSALVAWLADAGIDSELVDHCPAAGCEICAPAALAPAA